MASVNETQEPAADQPINPAAPAAAPESPSTGRRFGALRHPQFMLFWFSVITSNTGYWMQTVAQGFLIYQLTGSKTLLVPSQLR